MRPPLFRAHAVVASVVLNFRQSQRILPAAFAPAVAVGSFGVAGFGLAGLGAMQSLSGAHGGGALLSAGLVALAAAAAWILTLLSSVGAGWRGPANDLAR
ncbi:MAG: hypothetical protein R3B97_07295 [Dehalococcoidia bacterium]|nr:hypothetical protein [Dehalococcoidia bacterium]MCB9485707.1 hypothetical protein [Thermoflexaceae bacterium]